MCMEYSEIVRKLQANERIDISMISGVQMFMLLHDKILNRINYKSKGVFEFNFIPVEENEEDWSKSTVIINDKTCPNIKEAENIVKSLIDNYIMGLEVICINLDSEAYKLVIEILESHE